MSNSLERWATWRELQAQPNIWRAWNDEFKAGEVRDWLATLEAEEVWFCGAGTSAFIGDIIVAGLEGQGARMRSVATTDLVSRPHAYLSDRRPLVVNFGRSGGSPETLGTLDALDVLAPDAPRLNVTCNPDGALARREATGPCGVVLLPTATHDAGFAMTSSFSTMLLTALTLFDKAPPADALPRLAAALEALLPRYAALAEATPPPARVVFLGTGPMAFAAREAALKVMELTAGKTAALWDSTLGFRHGPKSFVDSDTRIVVFTSADPQAASYEADLLDELSAQYPGAGLTTVGPQAEHDPQLDLPDVWLTPLAVALAQVLGVVWSDRMGLNVDDPFAGEGTLSRVVSGVTLYPVRPE
ncbi:putative tagatose-6-phosphate aldose/ketose isomerase [Oceanicola granulosus HTCC2516]|uniref:Putative tagatose-6-phosphate aldose/ketose isomerase n=1 Tax=Oceanicola granulosus (strain ATCC BAA-861 / DSM 15982 / KCTC 12143 / HTCC2516) TaxID=314256 RepID=Q2CFC6_OCEGH|nr:SIS domain-containing protein [Oceanicola granulosus]EAR51369.1 putative tagatose-6-phosphate aldose/ketose isomerase [Oceanicola granulosus HTCC2516]